MYFPIFGSETFIFWLVTGALVFVIAWAWLPLLLVKDKYLTDKEKVEVTHNYRSDIWQFTIVFAGVWTLFSAAQSNFQEDYKYGFSALRNDQGIGPRFGGMQKLRQIAIDKPSEAKYIFPALATEASVSSTAWQKAAAPKQPVIIPQDAQYALSLATDHAFICGSRPEKEEDEDKLRDEHKEIWQCTSQNWWDRWRGVCRNPELVRQICEGLHLNMGGSFFRGASLRRANLTGAELFRSDLAGSDLFLAHLYGADLRESNLDGADLTRADLSEAQISGASFCGGPNYAEPFLRARARNSAQMMKISLRGARADDKPARFTGAELTNGAFQNAILPKADFRHANLYNAEFAGSVLREAKFDGANLEHANFQKSEGADNGVDLSGATFLGANLNHANFSGAKVSDEQLMQAERVCDTTMPNGTKNESKCVAFVRVDAGPDLCPEQSFLNR